MNATARATNLVRRSSLRKATTLALGALLASGLSLNEAPSARAAAFACEDPSNLCIDSPGDASWEPGKRSTTKHKKRRSMKLAGTLSLTIEGGRGSVFVNGRYVGTAPIDKVKVPRGKNDLQVRDGAEVLASGLIVVPNKTDVTVTVRHP